MAIEKKK